MEPRQGYRNPRIDIAVLLTVVAARDVVGRIASGLIGHPGGRCEGIHCASLHT